jgi:hypothetical protein
MARAKRKVAAPAEAVQTRQEGSEVSSQELPLAPDTSATAQLALTVSDGKAAAATKNPPVPIQDKTNEPTEPSSPRPRDFAATAKLELSDSAPDPLINKPRGRVPRKPFYSEMPDKGLFGLFAIAGFLSIIALKVLGFPAEILGAMAVGAMIAYALLSYHLPNIPLRPDRLGDNIYYLGFVYTLASMSAALIQLRGGISLNAVLENFGIALFTTIFGVAGRVILVQMRGDLENTEESIRRDLLDAASRMKDQMLAAIGEMQAFRVASRQAIEEQQNELLTRFSEAGKSQLGLIQDLVERALTTIERALGERTASAEQLRDVSLEAVQVTRSIIQKVAEIEVPGDLIERKFGALAAKMQATAESFEALAEKDIARQRALVGMTERLSELEMMLGQEIVKLRDHTTALVGVEDGGRRLEQGLAMLQERFKALADSVERGSSAMEVVVQRSSDAQKKIEDDLAASRSSVASVQRSLAEIWRKLPR